MEEFRIAKPTPGTYTDPDTGVQFKIDPPSQGKDPKAFFSFSVVGGAAVVYHVGINGGTNTAWYDYVNNTPSNPAVAGDGVIADTNLHSTPDSQYRSTPASKNTFFVASHTTFCYEPLTVEPSCDEPFSGLDSAQPPGRWSTRRSSRPTADSARTERRDVLVRAWHESGLRPAVACRVGRRL